MDKFRSLTLFISTIESGSFSATAKKHATDPSTVSKAIKRLEQQLGIQLFYRSTRKLSLTSAGHKYAQTVGRLYKQLESFEKELTLENDGHYGHLKLNLPVSYGRTYIVPMLSQFKNLYPEISLEVSFNDEYVDMIGHSVDLAIRSGTLSDSRLVAQKLTPMDFLLCASDKFNHTQQFELSSAHLEHLPWIVFRFKQTGKIMPIDFVLQGKRITFEPKNRVIVDDGEAMAELCAAGLGLAIIPHFTVKKAVMKGQIKVLAKLDDYPDVGIFVVYPKQDSLPKRSKLFISCLKEFLHERGENKQQTWATIYTNLHQ